MTQQRHRLFPWLKYNVLRLRDARDIEAFWPTPCTLRRRGSRYYHEEDGEEKLIVTEDVMGDFLEDFFRRLPPSVGIHKFHSLVAKDHVGVRQSHVRKFLRHSIEHQKHGSSN